MYKATYHFPDGFLWGTATASYQVEGHNTNSNWYAWEKAGNIIEDHQSGEACDWWQGRWQEDLDLASSNGHNAHRLSIEWSRVQPTPDRWDEDAIDKYREIVRGLKERGMTPMVTLHHFSEPLWITDIGGWKSDEITNYFNRYVKKIVEALKELVNFWITINEPNIYTVSGYLYGTFPPGKHNFIAAGNVIINMVRAHAQAYRLIHTISPNASVGVAHNYHSIKPKHAWSPIDKLVTKQVFSTFNELFPRALDKGLIRFPFWRIRIPEAKGTQDFFGLNYYTREYLTFKPLKPKDFFIDRKPGEGVEIGDTGMIASEPAGLFEALKWSRKYNLPIIITENGIDNKEDGIRRRYLVQHLHQIWRGINFNWPIKGYFHWTLVDNFEWERGWTQRFGLWELDLETQARIKRPSADLFAEVCAENGLSSELVVKYADTVMDQIFPQ